MNFTVFEDAGVIGFFRAWVGGILEGLIIIIEGFTLFEDLRYFRGITVLLIEFYGISKMLVAIVFIGGC